jgi:glycerol-3-phosphate acyltransferase PlsY
VIQENIIIGLTSYFLGAIPWAYIFVKLFSKSDIRNLGTGNIGAMNSYDVTGEKWIGILVFIFDALKGILAVLFSELISNSSFLSISIASILVMVGHNYNIFLKFRGGRGLASALGATLLINPIIFIIWAFVWVLSYYIIIKNIHIGNIAATFITPLILYFIPQNIFKILLIYKSGNQFDIFVLTALICLLILTRHIQPLRELIKSNSKKK